MEGIGSQSRNRGIGDERGNRVVDSVEASMLFAYLRLNLYHNETFYLK